MGSFLHTQSLCPPSSRIRDPVLVDCCGLLLVWYCVLIKLKNLQGLYENQIAKLVASYYIQQTYKDVDRFNWKTVMSPPSAMGSKIVVVGCAILGLVGLVAGAPERRIRGLEESNIPEEFMIDESVSHPVVLLHHEECPTCDKVSDIQIVCASNRKIYINECVFRMEKCTQENLTAVECTDAHRAPQKTPMMHQYDVEYNFSPRL
ncbi:uncharacterized protein LOC135210241 [Macrobrachium nipponense]|uniref:uncharacterized protein LOC135210241 n=1 Tax=Macrobrachium nipponense TaxID=159736 RepID=UPI0030C7A81A